MRKLLEKILGIVKEEESTREQVKQHEFAAEARQQLLILKKKGLGIPIFTL